MKFRGFTLAEVMIVLTVIGVLTAILLPVARQNMPNEDVMKFKKAHNTLGTVIRELVTSDKYYKDGDLGIKPDGTLVDGKHEGDYTYFCKTFSDIVNAKSTSCDESITNANGYITNPDLSDSATLQWMDSDCKLVQSKIENPIQTINNIFYYSANPKITFASSYKDLMISACMRDDPDSWCTPMDYDTLDSDRAIGVHKNSDGFELYAVHFCMDIDGLNQGEDPFGYGIRADGKILAGKRATEWLEKSIQEKD